MKRTILKSFTILWLFGMYVVLLSTFLAAYQSTDKAVTVDINMYNEANIELFVVLLSLFISTIGMLYIFSDIMGNLNQRVLKKLVDETFHDDVARAS